MPKSSMASPMPMIAEPGEDLLRALRVGHDRALGDLQIELASLQPVRRHQAADVIGKLRVQQAAGGEVDRDRAVRNPASRQDFCWRTA